MTEKELDKAIGIIQNRFSTINSYYVRKAAEQILMIGELGPANINRLRIMAEVTSDANEITRRLSRATSMTAFEISSIFNRTMNDMYTDPRFTAAFSAGRIMPLKERETLKRYVRAYAAQTAGALENLTNTTMINDQYREIADRAVFAVTSGLGDYNSLMRDTVRKLGYSGMQVFYPTGYHRRIDTAVRSNILEATRQVYQHCAEQIGEALEYDAVELSVHLRSAPDHEPVQGHVFLKEEYEKLQSGGRAIDINKRIFGPMRRAIGFWNCRHFPMPFSTEYSVPQYTDAQLRQIQADNHAGCEIDGKHYTTYEASQLMRKYETEVRRWKDTAVAAQITGDDTLRRQCQMQINALVAKYGQISKLSGIPQQKERMTVEGFKMVNLKRKNP